MEQRILIPIFMFGCITYVVKLLIDARMRYLLLRMAAAEDVVRGIVASEQVQRRHASLRTGITLGMVALGFALIESFGWRDVTPGVIAVLAGALSAGNLIYYHLARRWATSPDA
ncbi:hypothetical protein [Tahibacter amnicola]|uniref:DUF202 domain-containing protein n=1 Tax=Tahibacter amnicola TaxID=2976241 RepID=A0ABY6BBJ2_9GAMM|nr:hypothetical protein [Tahibacter amnicola]UXI66508.1 hypothetical protein N4264_17360 [Tahibacter amnicola]